MGDDDEASDQDDYRSKVGSLIYSMLGTRPDLGFGVGQLSRFLHNPSEHHACHADQCLQYLKFTTSDGLRYTYEGKSDEYSRREAVSIIAYSDAEWAGDTSDSISTSGYVITMANAPVVWRSF